MPNVPVTGRARLLSSALVMLLGVLSFESSACYTLSVQFSDYRADFVYVQLPTLLVGILVGRRVSVRYVSDAGWRVGLSLMAAALLLALFAAAASHPI